MSKDYLIIGQGLAGSFLAWNLLKRNKTVTIADDNHRQCSSLAAAGMVNPITGKRLVLSQRCEELLPFAKKVYHELENDLGQTFFEEKKIIRMFRDDVETQEWEKKSRQSHLKKYYGQKQPAGSYGDVLNDIQGSFIIEQGGYCRKLDLLKCLKNYFLERSHLVLKRFDHSQLRITSGGAEWEGETYSKVVFCEGYQAQDNPWFSWLPYNHAKGEILQLQTPDPLPDAVISCGKWCVPLGEQQYMVGSTYGWDRFDCEPTQEGQDEILREIGYFVQAKFNVVQRLAGVRPIMKDLQPALGVHPQYPQLAIFNGLASKALIWGPFYARQMADFLVDNIPLERQADIARF
jgi:glycine/D-amino acid oxidase-like deaminating enzyme